jgi:hypothetical protein
MSLKIHLRSKLFLILVSAVLFFVGLNLLNGKNHLAFPSCSFYGGLVVFMKGTRTVVFYI